MNATPDELPRKTNPWIVLGIVLAGCALAGFILYQFVYRSWMPDRLTRQARVLVVDGDYKTAALKARRALQMNAKHVDGYRVMAEINEAMLSQGAVFWRQRVVDLDPRSVEDRVALIETALSFRELEMARHAFEGFEEEGKDSAAYFSAAGAMAAAEGNQTLAIESYLKAVERAPQETETVFALAAAQLGSDDYAVRRQGEQALEVLAEKTPGFALRVRRLIIDDLMRRELFIAASREASALAESPDSEFSDRLRSVELLLRTEDSAYPGALTALEQSVAGNAIEAGALLFSLVRAGRYDDAVAWGGTLSDELREDPAVNAPLALAHALSGGMEAAQELAEQSEWGKFEYLRNAILAKARWDEGETPGFQARWNLAVASAKKEPEALVHLSSIAAQMGWNNEVRALRWPIARGNDRDAAGQALRSLHEDYGQDGNTQGLLNVLDRLLELSPGNPALLNNRAMLSLLLDTKLDRALETARTLHENSPADPNYASTYAFALYRAGREQEALEVMESLPSTALQSPAVAGYHGLILSANGRAEEAAPFFERAAEAVLLPEEKTLFERAAAQN